MLATVAGVEKAKVPVVAVARLWPLTNPVTVPAKAGLAKPYWRVAALAVTVSVAGVTVRRPLAMPVKS